jgi:predicted amidohydrolase YtcJ
MAMLRTLNMTPTLILYNGNVHTVDNTDSIVQAVAIWDNVIVALGDDESVLSLAGPSTHTFDLQGRSLIPGIIDSHNHPWEAGKFFEGLVTFGIMSIDELKGAIRDRIGSLEPGQWLQGGGFIETQFRENRMPNRWDLDEAAPDNPVVLERIFSACVANSRALQLAGITSETADPEGGEIDRDSSTGEPTGILHRSAKLLVRKAMPGPFGASSFGEADGTEDSIRTALREYLKYGITGIVEPGVSPAICKAYQRLYEKGELALRVNLMPNWHGFALQQEREHMDRLIEEMGFYTGFGNEWLRLGALKMAIDGGLTSRTALKSWPYVDEELPRTDVPLRLDLAKLDEWVGKAHDSGWSVGIHVVGDIAQDKAVESIYKAYQRNPVKLRHQIIHGYYPTPSALEQMAEAGIIAALQGAFIYGEADGYPGLLSEEKQRQFLPVKSYMRSGVTVALSTDMPSAHHNPFWGMYSTVTRKGMQGHQLGREECVSSLEALRMMTLNGAYLTGEERIKGSIEPGKLADMVVLDRDLLATTPEDLRHIQVDLTIIDGKVVYER